MGSGSFLKVLLSNIDVLAGYCFFSSPLIWFLVSPWTDLFRVVGRNGVPWLPERSVFIRSVEMAEGKRARIVAWFLGSRP
jgi:hypothetical protein